MDRYVRRLRVRRDSGLPHKRDTPQKPTLSRRNKNRRFELSKCYEALPEEPEVEERTDPTVKPKSPLRMSKVPVHCESVLCLSNPALTENPRLKAASPATPADQKSGYQVSQAGRQALQVTPIPEAFTGGNLADAPESVTSDVEPDTHFISDDENCYSSASTTSSSLPSPEIFRKENYVETPTFPLKEELLDLHFHIKNSTLLDVSNAESIHTHHPPNLSTIIDGSTLLAENNCEIRNPETKMEKDSFKSVFKIKTPSKLTNRLPILCKKKVWFKSPIVAETFETKHTPAFRLSIHNPSEPLHTSGPPEQIKPDAEDTSPLMVTLKRPDKSSLVKVKFFNFASDNDRNVFFQKMRERHVKLNSAALFPLTAAKYTGPSV